MNSDEEWDVEPTRPSVQGQTRCRRCLEWNDGDPWFCPRCASETTITPHDQGTLGDRAVWTRHAPCQACGRPMQDSDECHQSGLCLHCLLGPPPPPPGDYECCASGSCEVCRPFARASQVSE